MAAFLDLCRFIASAGGTSDWTYSSTVSPYISPATAGAVNGQTYKVRAESADLTQWEVSEGAYSSAGAGSFARTTVLYNSAGTGTLQGGAGSKISFTAAPQVWVVASKLDLPNLSAPNEFLDATDATSATSTGNSRFAGGLGVAKKLFVGLAATIGGVLKTTDTTDAASTASGALQSSGGLGVAGAGWFGGLVRSAAGFQTSHSPATAAQLDSSAMSAIAIANGANAPVTPASKFYGILVMVDATNGYAAQYIANGGGVGNVFVSGTWVAPTTSPAAGKCSVAWNGSGYSVYNNTGASLNVRAMYLAVQ